MLDKEKKSFSVHNICCYKSVKMSKTLLLCIAILAVLQITDAHQCNDNFANKIIELFSEKVVCEECAEDGSCLGQLAPVVDHCMICGKCLSGFMRDKKGRCRFLLRNA